MTDNLNLRRFREEKLKITQAELARHLDTRQDQISRLEQDPGAMPIDMFSKLCDLAGMLPNEVLQFQLSDPMPLHMKDSYYDLRVRTRLLDGYLRSGAERWNTMAEGKENSTPKDDALEYIQQLKNVLETYSSKPLVAFLGRSDAGKSRMINALVGANALPARWQPATSIRVYVKHQEDRPDWMQEKTWVFKRPAVGGGGWDHRRFRDKDYRWQWRLDGGFLEISQQLATRDGDDPRVSEAEAAVVYLDSPLLQACDIIDLPGFVTGDRFDRIPPPGGSDP